MRVENGFVPAQLLEPIAPLKNIHFSKDAEIAEKTIKMATAGVGDALNFGGSSGLNDTFASRRGVDLITNLTMRKISGAVNAAELRQTSRAASDRQFDGHLVGANGQTFAPGTAVADVPAVEPRAGARNNETLIYINGISTNKDAQAASLQAIADTTGSRTIGIHNSTQGGLLDVVQSLGDKLDIGNNPAVNTLADTVYDEIKAGRPVHLVAHSQGGIITSRALTDVYNRLRTEDGMSRRAARDLMSNIKVETFGGASKRYPDGPQYVHYVNRRDAVPQLFGLRQFLNPFADAGRGAVTHHFSAGSGIMAHGFEDIYLPERVPFEQARRGDFN